MFRQLQHIRYWLLAIGYWLFSALPVQADPPPSPAAPEPGAATLILEGLKKTAEKAGLKPAGEPAIGSPAAFAGQVVGVLLAFVGAIFFVLMLYGGIIWMTARGNEERIKKAQELIKSAVMGIVIVFLSYSVTNFLLRIILRAAG